ncbi:PD-(D/E)XK nuclease family protein [Noviherbaspirillum malthae]|uniref:PD-(D/E)XK nuclease family protein n=1 Tax=Noviherbaspirillum malthae TaxID=1260987 RepID=UPI001890A083|nr:PD-(D/E)XK nuclease family protein [Noviherbaspirillum malthae]
MDIFSTIEGLSGENFGSKLLSYLIFNSDEVREAFIALLSDNSPNGPISYTSHFACRTEYQTTDRLGNGRLDVLIQLDDVVIGIENKFFAQFQENQPFKYVSTLETVAAALKSINRTEVRSLLYILCPESRKEEAKAHIGSTPRMAIITWEEVLVCLGKVREVSNPVARIVTSEFIQYLKRHFSFVQDFERKAVHLNRAFPQYGAPVQAELVAKLWSLFPSPGGRIANGKTWLGYYFYSDPEIKEKGWFGFVPKEELNTDISHVAELIIVSTYNPTLDREFEPVRLRNDNFIGAPNNTHAWRVKFDGSWNNVEKWRQKLAPFWNAAKGEAVG